MAASSIETVVDDPRVTAQFCRSIRHPGGEVVLLGVVHDHPASIGRVRTVIERVDPDTLALELPSAAVPLYRAYARDERSPPRFGGEMSAAIDAVSNTEVVGIDAPNWPFVRRLVARLVADRVSPSTARRVLSSLGNATRDALTSRVAATVTDATSLTVAADEPVSYSCTRADDPETQAAHERAHVAGVRALLGGTEDEVERPTAYRDDARERCMVEQLRARRADGSVVAVVGADHLDALEAGLSDSLSGGSTRHSSSSN
ncbi:hypothetical protein EL22_07350 [Halostagnicola sp. A56]|uniref:hypothetical protein n=1 Tax=Halostagnicola sp. A56 TaxID=1495067 RepID=UPI00049FB90E|nr:hypothetical protein [Halostagnicola sp. A56]KDE58051.1 hypothetical protein EL22_07350 [Halostagnicola sp. A56]